MADVLVDEHGRCVLCFGQCETKSEVDHHVGSRSRVSSVEAHVAFLRSGSEEVTRDADRQ